MWMLSLTQLSHRWLLLYVSLIQRITFMSSCRLNKRWMVSLVEKLSFLHTAEYQGSPAYVMQGTVVLLKRKLWKSNSLPWFTLGNVCVCAANCQYEVLHAPNMYRTRRKKCDCNPFVASLHQQIIPRIRNSNDYLFITTALHKYPFQKDFKKKKRLMWLTDI